jgi:hypothetical protein
VADSLKYVARPQQIPAKDSAIPHSVAKNAAASRPYRLVPRIVWAAILLWQAPLGAEPVALQADTEIATAGYYQLSWDADGAIVLQEAASPDFRSPREVYRGADNARVMSGKADGDWYYRARTAGSGSDFGNVVRVTVEHHPVERAFAFFSLGALVFLITLGVIIRGARS